MSIRGLSGDDSEDSALTFFRNIADRLLPGGVLLITVPDANVLIRRLRDLPEGQLEFGNSLYTVQFYEESKAAQWCLGSQPFGCRYKFTLKVGDEARCTRRRRIRVQTIA